MTYTDPAQPINALTAAVSPAGRGQAGNDAGAIEARIPVRLEGPWRAVATGEASVEIQRSTLLGALWWAVRKRVRSDLLL